jgi:hypothetical protein
LAQKYVEVLYKREEAYAIPRLPEEQEVDGDNIGINTQDVALLSW